MLSQRLALGFWDLGILVLHLSALLERYSGTQGLGLWFDIRLKLRHGRVSEQEPSIRVVHSSLQVRTPNFHSLNPDH